MWLFQRSVEVLKLAEPGRWMCALGESWGPKVLVIVAIW
jgi:hypothetical protein